MLGTAIKGALMVPAVVYSHLQPVSRTINVLTVHQHAETSYINTFVETLPETAGRNLDEPVTRIQMKNEVTLSRSNSLIHGIVNAVVRFTQPVFYLISEIAQDFDSSIAGPAIDDDDFNLFTPVWDNTLNYLLKFLSVAENNNND
jgi:hypothetical protein